LAVIPFTISVPESTLEDLRYRLRATRWTDQIDNGGWRYGMDVAFLKKLVTYWSEEYDWRTAEAHLNRHEQVLVDAGGLKIHAVIQRATDPNATTLLLLHGWPDSFWRYQKVLPLLKEFNLVVPSLPGYGFTALGSRPGVTTAVMADMMVEMMSALGYDSYVVHGGDIGGFVAADMAHKYPKVVRALHFTDIEGHVPDAPPADASEIELAFFAQVAEWYKEEGGFHYMQSTKPQTAAVGLNDSPAGLAAWLVEKFRAYSDCGGDVLTSFTLDELITNLTIYWVTQSIGPAFRVYYEGQFLGRTFKIDIPTGIASYPAGLLKIPREFSERFFNLVRWRDMPRGGHFPAFEVPEIFAADLIEFIHELG